MFIFSDDDNAATKTELRLGEALEAAQLPVTDLTTVFSPAPIDNAANALIAEGREAFDNLDTDLAQKKLKKALEFLERNPAIAEPAHMAEVHAYLGAISMQLGTPVGRAKANESLTRAAVFDPTFVLDPNHFGTDVKKEWDRIVKDLEARARVRLVINSSPPGAEVTLRGASLGSTPLSGPQQVVPGRHLVKFTLAGHSPTGLFVDVMKATVEASATLPPLPALEAARSKAQTLLGAAADGVPVAALELATSTGARFIVVGTVDSLGIGHLDAYDTQAKRSVHEVPLRETLTSAVAQVKRLTLGTADATPSLATGSPTATGQVEARSVLSGSFLPSLRGANTVGTGLALRAGLAAGTSAALTAGVIGFEVAAAYALTPSLDVGAELRVPLAPSVTFSPGLTARWKFVEDGHLSLAVLGSIDLPFTATRGRSVGLSVAPGVVASYSLTEKAELFAAVILSYNQLFYSNPVVIGTGQAGLMGTCRGGLSFAVAGPISVYANIDLSGGYEPLRRNIVIGNSGTGVAMTGSLMAGAQIRLQ